MYKYICDHNVLFHCKTAVFPQVTDVCLPICKLLFVLILTFVLKYVIYVAKIKEVLINMEKCAHASRNRHSNVDC